MAPPTNPPTSSSALPRRKSDFAWDALISTVEQQGAEIAALKADVAANTAATRRIEQNTDGLPEMMLAWKSIAGGLRVLGWLGKPVTWAASIVTAAGAIYVAWKGLR